MTAQGTLRLRLSTHRQRWGTLRRLWKRRDSAHRTVEKSVALARLELVWRGFKQETTLQSPLGGAVKHQLICGDVECGSVGTGVLQSTWAALLTLVTRPRVLHKGYPHTEAAKLQKHHILTHGQVPLNAPAPITESHTAWRWQRPSASSNTLQPPCLRKLSNVFLLKEKCLKEIPLSAVKSLSRVRLFAVPWTVAHQAPPSMGFSRQEDWGGVPLPSPGDLTPHIEGCIRAERQ